MPQSIFVIAFMPRFPVWLQAAFAAHTPADTAVLVELTEAEPFSMHCLHGVMASRFLGRAHSSHAWPLMGFGRLRWATNLDYVSKTSCGLLAEVSKLVWHASLPRPAPWLGNIGMSQDPVLSCVSCKCRGRRL